MGIKVKAALSPARNDLCLWTRHVMSGTEQKSRVVWGLEEIKRGVNRKDANMIRKPWHEEDEGVPEIDF